MKMRGDSAGRRAEAGFVLVATLWMLAALALLASIYSVYARESALASKAPEDRLIAEAAMRAGVELAVYQSLAAPERAKPRRGRFEARVGPSTVVVDYRTEGARIDLNAAPKDLLAGLFRAVGADEDQAGVYADRIVAWRKSVKANVDNPEAEAYAAAGLPYGPRQAAFNNALELSLVRDVPATLVERVLPFVTVFSGQARVDAVEAEPTTLAALPGMTPEIVKAVLDARAKTPGDGQAILKAFGPAQDRVTLDPSKTLRASIAVRLADGGIVRGEVVFRLKDDPEDPYDLLYWRDDRDGPLNES